MKNIKPLFAVILLSLLITGCGTTNTQRAEKTSISMETVESDINKVSVQVSATEASLQNLISANPAEMQEAFESYKDNVDRIVDLESDLRNHTNEMKTRGNEYFTQWQIEGESYNNPELRKVSEQRRAELRQTFNEVSESSTEINRDLKTYISDLQEIESYLSNDLTSKGIQSITPISQRVNRNGQDLKRSINQMQGSIATTKTEMRKMAQVEN